MWRALAALAVSLVPNLAHATVEAELAAGLRAPGVNAIALLFRGERFDRDVAVRLRDRFEARGLAIWVVTGHSPREPCKPAGLYRVKVICRDEVWRERFGIGATNDGAFLWNWRGRRLATNVKVEALAQPLNRWLRSAPRVAVKVRGAAATDARRSFRRAIVESKKLAVFDEDTESSFVGSVELPRKLGRCNAPSSSDTMLLVSGPRGTLIDVGVPCTIATASGSPSEIIEALVLRMTSAPSLPEPIVRIAEVEVANVEASEVEPTGSDQLRSEADRWVGVRFKRWGKDRRGVDDVQLVRVIFRHALGIEAGLDRRDMYRRGDEITLDTSKRGLGLLAGDLVFVVGRPNRPRHVGLYLGEGEWIHAVEGRGVVIDTLSTHTPKGTWLVGRRPER